MWTKLPMCVRPRLSDIPDAINRSTGSAHHGPYVNELLIICGRPYLLGGLQHCSPCLSASSESDFFKTRILLVCKVSVGSSGPENASVGSEQATLELRGTLCDQTNFYQSIKRHTSEVNYQSCVILVTLSLTTK